MIQQYQFIVDILITAGCWVLGAMLGEWLISKIKSFRSQENDPEIAGSISSDDLLDFDDAEKPYIPVNIVKENGLYYAWFTNNDKFIGQSKNTEELRVMAHEEVVKALGLRFEFKHERKAKVKPVTAQTKVS
jgi:hypothetical protein